MPLMVSISGIRGVFGDGLDAMVLVKYAAAFGVWVRNRASETGGKPLVAVGRDARVTGELCQTLVMETLRSVGCNVLDVGLATTPTVEMAVLGAQATGGIILSASHNPAEWNALKLLNENGEFLTPEQGKAVIDLAASGTVTAVPYTQIGGYSAQDYLPYHIQKILELPYIYPKQIAAQDFKVVVDGVNSVGGVAIPALLKALGIREENIIRLHCNPTGLFAHNPEPLPEHLSEIMDMVTATNADLGIVVDPDADRLAFVAEDGHFYGEELTQVTAADFMLGHKPGPFATNLSSSRAADDVVAAYGQTSYRAAVGEINVVMLMKEVGAVVGGEGNGGVILPDLHHGRDALVGTAIVLQHMVNTGKSLSQLKAGYPAYSISKNKITLDKVDADTVLRQIAQRYQKERISTIDGVKIDFPNEWVHLRKSNTEPIIRIYAEARTPDQAQALAQRFMDELAAVESTP
ncbi:MAG: phosphoglucosamine mutase [Bacteroidetes Order II. Incertae sedis bacterium]|nr:phosphoglucosamine mutase [Bacteroidetes Order II. bacterium]